MSDLMPPSQVKPRKRGRKRRLVAPGTALLTWEGPIHKTVFIQRPLNPDELKKQAQRMAIELGPDHPRVRMLKKQIEDLLQKK